MNNIKIIPILVIVAMLSFSVRLVDVLSGASSLSGAAHAESKKEEMHKEFDDDHASMEEGADDEHKAEEIKTVDAHDEVLPEWRDPAEDDPAYEASRMEVFKDLSKRHEELEQKERALRTKEALLRAAEQELDQKFQELSQLRGKIENLLENQSEEEQARITSLVKIYEGMKPKDAARIFDTLDIDILVSVVSQMSERKLSPILAAMNAERARTVTIMLAEQKQLPSLL